MLILGRDVPLRVLILAIVAALALFLVLRSMRRAEGLGESTRKGGASRGVSVINVAFAIASYAKSPFIASKLAALAKAPLPTEPVLRRRSARKAAHSAEWNRFFSAMTDSAVKSSKFSGLIVFMKKAGNGYRVGAACEIKEVNWHMFPTKRPLVRVDMPLIGKSFELDPKDLVINYALTEQDIQGYVNDLVNEDDELINEYLDE